MIGGDGNTIAIFTYAHDYQRSRCKGRNPVSGAGSISANTMESVSFMVVTRKMSVSSQHEAPICWRYSPALCERDISIDLNIERGWVPPLLECAENVLNFSPFESL